MFLNGKRAPWADGGIKLLHNDQDFFILTQSKRKEKSDEKDDLSEEWNKVFKRKKNYIKKSLFIMITDGKEIDIKNNIQEKYPKNILVISKDTFMNFFGKFFSTLKILKTYDKIEVKDEIEEIKDQNEIKEKKNQEKKKEEIFIGKNALRPRNSSPNYNESKEKKKKSEQ